MEARADLLACCCGPGLRGWYLSRVLRGRFSRLKRSRAPQVVPTKERAEIDDAYNKGKERFVQEGEGVTKRKRPLARADT